MQDCASEEMSRSEAIRKYSKDIDLLIEFRNKLEQSHPQCFITRREIVEFLTKKINELKQLRSQCY